MDGTICDICQAVIGRLECEVSPRALRLPTSSGDVYIDIAMFCNGTRNGTSRYLAIKGDEISKLRMQCE